MLVFAENLANILNEWCPIKVGSYCKCNMHLETDWNAMKINTALSICGVKSMIFVQARK